MSDAQAGREPPIYEGKLVDTNLEYGERLTLVLERSGLHLGQTPGKERLRFVDKYFPC